MTHPIGYRNVKRNFWKSAFKTVQSRGITKIDEVIRTRGVITEEQTYKANTLQVLGLLNVNVDSKIYRGGNI